ncbi:serine hydrolase domain-containing protein [Chitinophaga polysaccharea]|uniref:serine hydrolase domain-containing protein n=1 Tax=Chitinophaga polysaccharea TaxID=1293035 RepID=UPI00115A125F|nr:serine hydrolase domain-containing protein [Chitinophaga polysaccharea]
MKQVLFNVAIILVTSACYGQTNVNTKGVANDNPLHTRLDSLIDHSVQQYLQDRRAVGISIGILLKDKACFYNYGETKAGNNKLPRNNTLYEIGSTTKTFTGILLGQAVLDKKIRPDDDIRKYLKGAYPNLEYKGIPIRVKDLSNHTSRITRIFPNMWERPEYDSLNPLHDYTRQLLYEGLHNMKMDTFPGKISSYSNMAVALLGTLLEDAYGLSYFSLISKNILEPLSMKDTRIDITALPADAIAWPHNENRQVVPLWDLHHLPAMGALRSTTRDLISFIKANNTDTSPAIALSHQPTFGTKQEGMGMNWFIHTSHEGYRILEHGGGTGGSRSSLECFPGLHSGFVILTNSLANRNRLEKELAAIVVAEAERSLLISK